MVLYNKIHDGMIRRLMLACAAVLVCMLLLWGTESNKQSVPSLHTAGHDQKQASGVN